MGTSFVLRAPTDADVDRLVELNHASWREVGTEPTQTAAEVRTEWQTPRFDRERHARVAEVDGVVVASAGMWLDEDQAHGGGYVLPSHRGVGIGRALQDWLLEAARTEGVAEYHTWLDTAWAGAVELIESMPGAEQLRTFIRMRNAHPAAAAEPEWPPGIGLVALEGDALVDAFIEAHDNSFVDHWNFTPTKREDVEHELLYPEFDPSLWFIAAAEDGRIAGFNICYLQRRDGLARGWLGPIGTTRPFRGIGLGRALLRHGLSVLAERGATEVLLGVDSQNPNGALGLYERNGFEVIGQGRVYGIKI